MPRFDAELSGQAEEACEGRRVEEVEREAFERGFAQGEYAGLDMGRRKAAVLLEKAEELLQDLASLRKNIVAEAEVQAAELAAAIARKVILRELSLDPATLVEMTKEALARLEKTGQVIIRIHPAVHELFIKHRPELLNLHPDIVFSADCSVSPLGSMVRGPSEEVSTDIDEQLAVIQTEMREAGGRD